MLCSSGRINYDGSSGGGQVVIVNQRREEVEVMVAGRVDKAWTAVSFTTTVSVVSFKV